MLSNSASTASRDKAGRLAVLRNERLTALAGSVLLVLIVVELIITVDLHALIPVHIFIGMVLSGPLLIKLFSTGYRFVRYYTGHPAFVQSGPPHPILRLLAPALLLFTLLVFVSGLGLAISGPTQSGLWFKIHAASTALWIPLVAVHVYAHIRKAAKGVTSDWGSRSQLRVSGRAGRLRFTLLGLALGLIGALVMIPISSPWAHWTIESGIPSPLALGLAAAVVGIVIAAQLLRGNRDA